ncbi:sarcosine oxidase subunit gamma [Falsiroseomonas sp. CW058]|uniref:sarcosine oxidase subunit gamma n=1 Tax=Falsiroseomonas sp. CW058 TaxID=3388664 RepID=UPI003D31927D
MSAAEPLHALAHVAPGHHGAPGAGLVIGFPRREVVQVLARRGAAPALAAAAQGVLGLTLPGPGGAAEAGGIAALWTQPEGWMLIAPWAGEGTLLGRASALAPHAALTDQSHGRSVIALSGPAWAQALARCCRLDLHPAAFPRGRVVGATVGHVQAVLHATGAGVELICFSTLAEELLGTLVEAGLTFGVEVAG